MGSRQKVGKERGRGDSGTLNGAGMANYWGRVSTWDEQPPGSGGAWDLSLHAKKQPPKQITITKR